VLAAVDRIAGFDVLPYGGVRRALSAVRHPLAGLAASLPGVLVTGGDAWV
jgi:hypothetical protein